MKIFSPRLFESITLGTSVYRSKLASQVCTFGRSRSKDLVKTLKIIVQLKSFFQAQYTALVIYAMTSWTKSAEATFRRLTKKCQPEKHCTRVFRPRQQPAETAASARDTSGYPDTPRLCVSQYSRG